MARCRSASKAASASLIICARDSMGEGLVESLRWAHLKNCVSDSQQEDVASRDTRSVVDSYRNVLSCTAYQLRDGPCKCLVSQLRFAGAKGTCCEGVICFRPIEVSAALALQVQMVGCRCTGRLETGTSDVAEEG